MKRLLRPIQGGVFIDDAGQLQINTNRDKLYRDIVLFNTNTSGQLSIDGVRVIYGYQYNPVADRPKLAQFRKMIKHPSAVDNIEEFVEAGVLHIDEYIPLDSFEVVVRIKLSYRPSILDTIYSCLLEHVSKQSMSYELIKATYQDVEFDEEKARQALLEAEYSEDDVDELIDSLLVTFDELKSSDRLFEMKRFLPRAIRTGFTNFLKFATDAERQAYERLQGVDVLIYDDLLTSGSTIREMARYLRSINPSNTLTAFVLIQ